MTRPFLGGPLILIVDDNLGRIEYMEFFFYQNRFQTLFLSVEQLSQGINGRDIDLVITYLTVDPVQFTDRAIPVIFIQPNEASAKENEDSSNPLVTYLSASEGPDALLETIRSLVDTKKH